MVRQAEMMLEMDAPVLPVAYEKIYDAWHSKVHGQNPAAYFGSTTSCAGTTAGWRASAAGDFLDVEAS